MTDAALKATDVPLPIRVGARRGLKLPFSLRTLGAVTLAVLVAAGGLMVTANLSVIAHNLKVEDAPVPFFGMTLPALTFALSLDRVMNGITRPFFGWVSDKIGRETTMCIAFGMEAAGIAALDIRRLNH